MTEAILHSCSFLQECQFLARRMCLILTGLFLQDILQASLQDILQHARYGTACKTSKSSSFHLQDELVHFLAN